MTTKIKGHIDPMGYDKKPSGKEIGGIKSRLQKNASPSLVTLEELVQKIATGHSISPGIMSGMSSKDWTEQQLFLVDIDNEEDEPILRMKDAKAICRDNGLSLAFYYQTFSCTKEHPKFRLAFVMDKPVTDKDMRKHIMETLVNLFPQSDKSCVNADRIFHGTNKIAKLLNQNARITWEDIEAVSFPTPPEKHHILMLWKQGLSMILHPLMIGAENTSEICFVLRDYSIVPDTGRLPVQGQYHGTR